MPRSSGLVVAALAVALLAAACASPLPKKEETAKPAPLPLPPLPATLINDPGCPGCLAVTLTLRPDGSYLVRDQIGASEFYDFGRWRYGGGALELSGERGTSRYPLATFRKSARVEQLRGPFRMVGVYDGKTFKECRTGLAWELDDTRAAETLKAEAARAQGRAVLVALDAQFEGSPEMLRVFRPASILDATNCPR